MHVHHVPLFLSAAAWSPSRPGLLFLATAAGSLHVWDLLDRSHEPSLRINIAGSAITSISFSSSPPKHATHSLIGMESGIPAVHADGLADGHSVSGSSGGAHPAQHAGTAAAAAAGITANNSLQVRCFCCLQIRHHLCYCCFVTILQPSLGTVQCATPLYVLTAPLMGIAASITSQCTHCTASQIPARPCAA